MLKYWIKNKEKISLISFFLIVVILVRIINKINSGGFIDSPQKVFLAVMFLYLIIIFPFIFKDK